MPPGIGGATVTRFSRAAYGWRTIVTKEFAKDGQFNLKKLDKLIEKVLVAYGDDSVGELEGALVRLENISNLAIKEIEDCRIGVAYIEQSSRYVFYNQKDTAGNFRYLKDKTKNPIMNSEYKEEYVKTMDKLFQTYCDLIAPMTDYFKKLKPITEATYDIKGTGEQLKLAALTDENDRNAWLTTYNFDIKTKACDTIRGPLPAATLSNVALFCNGRAYQNLLTKLYSSDVPEFKIRGEELHYELNKVIPRFVERAKPNGYIMETRKTMQRLVNSIFDKKNVKLTEDVTLLDNGIRFIAEALAKDLNKYFEGKFSGNISGLLERELPKDLIKRFEKEFEIRQIAVMLYKYTEHSMEQIINIVRELPEEKRKEIYCTYIGDRNSRRDKPGRALEYGYPLLYDLVESFGIYRDLQRHRMLTQERQKLTTRLGFSIPEEINEAGFEDKLVENYETASNLYEKIRTAMGNEIAQYVVPFGFNVRWYMGMNDREAMHMLELRTGKQGHPNYRLMCQKMHQKLKEQSETRASSMKFVDYNNYYWSRADSEARQRVKERKLNS